MHDENTAVENPEPSEPGKDYMWNVENLSTIPNSEIKDYEKIAHLAAEGLVCVIENGSPRLRIFSEEAYRGLVERLVFLECVYSTENVLKGKYNGSTVPIGYAIDSDRHFQIDPLKAPFVVEAFKRYAEGATMKDIMNWLNREGVKTGRNRAFTYGSVQTLLTNRRYIGENRFQDIVVPDTIPIIIEKELFDRVQEKMAKNRRAPARHKAEDDYLLTTKLFCGMCGAMMFGECGTGRNKVVHHYYKCYNAKRTHSCKKKTVRKVWLEDLVINTTMEMLQDDQAIDAIVEMVMQLQDQENTTLPLLEKQLKETETGIQNMLNAIQAGILTSSTKERLEALESQKKELEIRITEEKLAKPKLSADFVKFWLTRFRKLNPQIKSHRETLVNTFVNAIYLYDDKILLTFNYKEGTKTISLDDVAALAVSGENGSDLGCLAPPKDLQHKLRVFFAYPPSENITKIEFKNCPICPLFAFGQRCYNKIK